MTNSTVGSSSENLSIHSLTVAVALTDSAADEASAEPAAGGPKTRPTRREGWADACVVAVFFLAALFVTGRLWQGGAGAQLASNAQDQALFEWLVSHGARVLTQLENPFFSSRINVPYGINIMGNTSILALSVPFAPVTLLFGPAVTVKLLTTLCLAGTAISWYFVLSRRLIGSRGAAAIGAWFAAFAPGMISQSNGHLQVIGQFLVPIIVWRVLRLREGGRSVRNGVVLGLLITLQMFIGEEVLFFTAIGCGLFVGLMVLMRPELRREARPFLTGLGVAAGVAAVLLAYPLWVQFQGPQAYHGLRPDIRSFGTDLAAIGAFSRESLAGSVNGVRDLAQGPTEENAFYGWPLLALMVGLVWWMRRDRVVLAIAATGTVFLLCSLGPTITWGRSSTGIPGPWWVLQHVPILDSAVPTRFAIAAIPLIAILLALGYARAARTAASRPLLSGWAVAFAAALLPILPTPLPASAHRPTPDFIAAGTWREYVDDAHTLLTLPPGDSGHVASQRWAAETGLDLRIPLGYFLAPAWNPGHPNDGTAAFTGRGTPTSRLLYTVARTGQVPSIGPQNREDAVNDLRWWETAVVVLPPGERNAEALRTVATELFGVEPRFIGGVWVWDVRPLVRGAGG